MGETNRKTFSTLALGFALIIGLSIALYFIIPNDKAETPTPEQPEKTLIKLRFGHNISPDSALHLAAIRFADEVKRKSQGAVQISVHPNQELGNDHQMIDMAREGELDILLTPTAKLSINIPAMQYADLPFYFPDRKTLFAMLDGEPGQLLLDKLKTIGLFGVAFWGNGFKQFTANRAIHKPEDFAGLNIRVMKSRLLMKQFRAFGAHPMVIDFHTTRQALADKVIDGQENPLVAIVGMGFHEVQSHLTLSNHAYLGYVLSFSKKSFERLPETIQEILFETGRELTSFQREETDRQEARFLETVRTAGVQINELTDSEQQAFAKVSAPLSRQFEGVIGVDILSKTEELLMDRKIQEKKSEDLLLIGLDADLSQGTALAGLAIKRGLLLAMDEINQNGGVLGKTLALLARDHQGVPARGKKNIEDFIQHKKVVAIVGGLHSSVADAELELIQEAGIPFLIPWAATASLTENKRQPNPVFRISINDSLAGPFLLDHALKQENGATKKIALLLENSAWGRGIHKSLLFEMANREVSSPIVEWLNKGEDNFLPILGKVQQAGVTTIILVANPPEGIKIINGLAQLDAGISVVSHWGITGGAAFWEKTAKSLTKVNVVFPQTFTFNKNQRPKALLFGQSYLKNFGLDSPEEIPAPVGTAQAYDLLHLLSRAIEKAGSTDPAAIRTALESLGPYEGLITDIPHP